MDDALCLIHLFQSKHTLIDFMITFYLSLIFSLRNIFMDIAQFYQPNKPLQMNPSLTISKN